MYHIFTRTEDKIELYDTRKLLVSVETLTHGTQGPVSMAVHPASVQLAVCFDEGKLHIYDTKAASLLSRGKDQVPC